MRYLKSDEVMSLAVVIKIKELKYDIKVERCK